MDDLTREFYEMKFELAFRVSRGEAFQSLFSATMEKRYPGDFTRVRPWGRQGDEKCDGYHRSRRMLFQCYAPNELEAARCIAKMDADFAGALTHWREHFDTWAFVHNSRDGLGPSPVKKLLALERANSPLRVVAWGYEELRQEAMQLSASDLASLLGPAPSRGELTGLGLESLVPILDHIARFEPTPSPDLRPVPADKLEQNLLSGHVATLLKAGMSRERLVRRYFELKPELQDRIAESFRRKYAELRALHATPDEVFDKLHGFAIGDLLPSATRESAVLAVLAFFFAECDIFERPKPPAGDAP